MKQHPRSCDIFTLTLVLNALITWLVMVDYTEATCTCALNLTNRQYRDTYIHNYTETLIREFTANVTVKIKTISKSEFNLTTTLATFAGDRTLGQFAIQGGLANLSVIENVIAQGPQSLYVRYPCGNEYLFLDKYLTYCYFKHSENRITSLARNLNYSIGAYRVGMFNYTYISTDPQKTVYPFCACTSNEGFSYHIHLKIDATNLPPLYTNGSTPNGRLIKRDIELAMDYAFTTLFSEVYIHAKFSVWLNNITICAKLYFKDHQFDPKWNYAESNISQTLGNVTLLELNYQRIELPIISKPVIVSCHLYLGNGTYQACPVTQISTNVSGSNNNTLTVVENNINETLEELPLTQLPPEIENITGTEYTTLGLDSTSTTTLLDTAVSSFLGSTLSSTLSVSNLTTGFTNETALFSTITIAPNSTDNTTPGSVSIPTDAYTSTSFNSSASTTVPPGSTGSVYNTTNLGYRTTNSSVSVGTSIPVGDTVITPSTSSKSSPIMLTTNAQSTTSFDPDPFFKAQVPVIKKVYNDRELLRRMEGTIAPILRGYFFYEITIPSAFGMFCVIALCFACCHVDWVKSLAPKKKDP